MSTVFAPENYEDDIFGDLPVKIQKVTCHVN